MKKYKVLKVIGEVVTMLGITALLIVASADLERTNLSNMVVAGLVCIAVSLLGQVICNLDKFDGICFGLITVILAYLYKPSRSHRPLMKQAYIMKKKTGSYMNTFRKCRKIYSQHVESEC